MMPLTESNEKEPLVSHVSMHKMQHFRAAGPAWLQAVDQPLWVTRDGDPADHVLAPGERMAVARGDRLAVGAWHADGGVAWAWQPRARAARQGWARRAGAAALTVAARGLLGAADALKALAHATAAVAGRARGCIGACESIVPAGPAR